MTCEFTQAVVSHPILLINDAIVFKKCKIVYGSWTLGLRECPFHIFTHRQMKKSIFKRHLKHDPTIKGII